MKRGWTSRSGTSMSKAKFKTMRHIETVRNYLSACIRELMDRQEQHDQSKLCSPEIEYVEKYTPKLRKCTYGSEEYNSYLKEMDVALQHHYAHNSHHPEHYAKGVDDMTLLDLIEMVADWKSSSLRHNDGNLLKSIEINTTRFNVAPQLVQILKNTARWLEDCTVNHRAHES